MCILSKHAFTSMNQCRRCYDHRHYQYISPITSMIFHYVRNQNSNQYYKLIAFARAGCGRKSTTKEIIISHFLLRIFIFKCSNIPTPSAYGVYISQFMLYPRACGSWHIFRDRCLLLTRKLLNRGVLVVKQTASLRKLCGHHHDLVNQISVSQITCHLVFKKSNTTGVIIGAGTVPSPGSPGI